MKKFKNWYFPDQEEHFIKYLESLGVEEYQKQQRENSFKYLDNRRTALDVGANVGLWSRDICNIFDKAILFEPHEPNIECLKKNLENYNNFEILAVALSNETKQSNLYFNDNESGSSTIRQHKLSDFKNSVSVEVKKLDEFNFLNVDYIKIDVQFHELEVIEGGIDTLKKNNPVLCIESARRNEEELHYVNKFLKILYNIEYKVVGKFGKELFLKK